MRLSIVTATKNSALSIRNLIDDLNSQKDINFKWIIADCLSSDDTLEIINKYTKCRYQITSEKDSGIYDALNKSIKNSVDEYYLVVGSDDRLSSDAIESINYIIEKSMPDLIVNCIRIGERQVDAFYGSSFSFLGADRIVTGHSVGLVVNKKLHDNLGFYRTDLALASDAFFIYSLYNHKCNVFLNKNFVGIFSISGSSNQRRLRQICETFLVQLNFSKSKIPPFFLFFYRLLKNWRSL